MKCIYCYKDKEIEEFTSEHVIPKAIGGNIEPVNPFITKQVCKRCNNVAGIYIDLPFTKNWFMSNAQVTNSKKFVNLSTNPILPLRFFGKIDNITFEDKICEFWIGPTGDSIYHFHVSYPSENNFGRKPINKKLDIDNGFVFLFIVSNNPLWHPSIAYSTIQQFSKSTIYLGNANRPNLEPFKEIPDQLFDLREKLFQLNKEYHSANISIPYAFEDRFMAKLAIGLGSIFLDKSFIDSEDANKLREFMWEQHFQVRHKMDVHLTKFIKPKDDNSNFMKELFSWEGGHLIAFFSIGDHLFLIANFYEEYDFRILVSKNKKHWANQFDNPEGMYFVIVPGFKKAVGPMSIGSLIAFKNRGIGITTNSNLIELINLMENQEELPPYNI